MSFNVQSMSAMVGVSLLALAATTFPSAAKAQDEPGDIVVTARRVEERLQDVPISITVFNQQQLTNRNVVSAGDIATYTPSLSTNGRWGSESTTFSIRGFVQEGVTSPSVGAYFAEVVAPRANGGTTGGNGAGVGNFFDLANVQVLKGPQGTLFGRNTTGGAVLLTPQKPTGRFEGYIEGSYGNYDMQRIQGVINIPVMDTLRIRLGVDRQTREGYLNNISGIGPKDFADVDYVAARLSVVADLTPNLENYTIISYSKSKTNGAFPKVALQTGPGQAGFANLIAPQIAATSGNYYDVMNGHPNPYTDIEQFQFINTTTWKASDLVTIKNITSYAEFRQAVAINNNGDAAYVGGSPVTAISLYPEPGKNNISQSTFTEELQVQGRSGDDRLTYQAGAYLELSEPLEGFQASRSAVFLRCSNIIAFQCDDYLGRNLGAEGRVGQIALARSKYRFRNLGLYTQATYKISDKLSLTGGLRYTSDVTTGVSESLRVRFPSANNPQFECAQPAVALDNPGTYTSGQILADSKLCQYSRRVSSKKPTWLVDIDFKPVDDLLLYAKYVRGYRQGSLNISSYGLETWGPEKVDTYEVGAKSSFDGIVRGNFNIAAFYNDFSNQQLAVAGVPCRVADAGVIPSCTGFIAAQAIGIANAGKSTIKGVEIDTSIRLFEGFNLDASYAYLDTKLKSVTKPAIPNGFRDIPVPVAGGPLALTPKNKYSVTASYTLPLADEIGRITIAGTFTHQDSMLGQITSAPSLVQLPPQNNLNLNVNWNSVAGAPVDLGFFATNVTKEKYFVYTTGGADIYGYDGLILNQPRMYGVRLKYHFGA
ncbi:MAG TPA: TonB-dependent receptor [Sphingobium sp.]|uniref:TonB-dependent receptor n=1 Tax=Sphingobium sp. TaxID=1912891 RepID=UPI002ED3561D